MIIELDRLVIEWESLELVIKEEVHGLFSQLHSQALQEGYVVVNQLIVILSDVKACTGNQLIHEGVSENVN